MELRNRNTTVIILVVLLVVLCCCALVIATAAMGWLIGLPFVWRESTSLEQDRVEQSFDVGAAPSLEIDNFCCLLTWIWRLI